MNERFRLNTELIRADLRREGRTQVWLTSHLGVSGSLVNKMLCDGHVPKRQTLTELAVLLGRLESDLLIPRVAEKLPA